MKIGAMGSGMIVTMALESLKDVDGIAINSIWHRDVDLENAQALQKNYGVEYLYTDMDEFLSSDKFDTAYIGVINSLHFEYTKKALLAGKNVICEKPFMPTGKQAKEIIDLAKEKGLFLFEAIIPRYSLGYESVNKHLDDLGRLTLIECNYSQYSSRYDKYREGIVLPAFDPKYAGGCLYDINFYCIHFVIGLFGRPLSGKYYANIEKGIDTSGVVVLDYGTFKAVCCGAKDSNSPARYTIQGNDGYIAVNVSHGMTDIDLVKNKQQPEQIGVPCIANPMGDEFIQMKKIMDTKDYDLMNKHLETTLILMETLEMLRLDAGIKFDC